MKMKNIVVVIMAFCVTQALWAAKMTVYCESDIPVTVTAHYGSTGAESVMFGKLAMVKKHTFDSGRHSFRNLVWQSAGRCYVASIPSTPVMRFGTITLVGGAKYTIDFDVWGASANKLEQREANTCDKGL